MTSFGDASKLTNFSRKDEDRQKFTQDLIQALKLAQTCGTMCDEQHLAEAVYQKLQFDFPLVSAEELAALTTAYVQSAGYPLSVKYLNILRDGASSSGLATAEPAKELSTCSEVVEDPIALEYQKLYAVVLVKTLRRALEVWGAEESAVALGQLASSLEAVTVNYEKQRGQEHLFNAPEVVGEVSPHALGQQEDCDDFAYEPLETLHESISAEKSSVRVEQLQSSFTWEQEKHLLCVLKYLADQLDWHCLNGNAMWRDLGLIKEILSCLQAVRQHPSFEVLAQLVAEPLLRLIVDRVLAQPTDIACLDSICSVLDVADQENLHPLACQLTLSTAAVLACQLTNTSAQQKLWQVVNVSLLPLIARQLEEGQTTYFKHCKQLQHQYGPSAAKAPPTSEEINGCTAACQLVYFYVQNAPTSYSAATISEALLARGLFRALVMLFSAWSSIPQAESLRCALLLCCTSSPQLLQWGAAVPGFSSSALGLGCIDDTGIQVQLPDVHGALWSVLLQKEDNGQALVALLRTLTTDPVQVEALVSLLKLLTAMSKVHRDGKLWSKTIDKELHIVVSFLKTKSRGETRHKELERMSGHTYEILPHQTSGCTTTSTEQEERDKLARNHTIEQQCDSLDKIVTAAEDDKVHGPLLQHAQMLDSRRAQQLYPLCLKLLKELLQKPGDTGKHD